ncbi:MAG: hypothetical protein ACJAZX_001445 [Rickettsiales bacterium]|jgi:hypothetical protein
MGFLWEYMEDDGKRARCQCFLQDFSWCFGEFIGNNNIEKILI